MNVFSPKMKLRIQKIRSYLSPRPEGRVLFEIALEVGCASSRYERVKLNLLLQRARKHGMLRRRKVRRTDFVRMELALESLKSAAALVGSNDGWLQTRHSLRNVRWVWTDGVMP